MYLSHNCLLNKKKNIFMTATTTEIKVETTANTMRP